MKNSYQLVRVFHKANGVKGNLAAVVFDHADNKRSALLKVSADIKKHHGVATTCFIKHIVDEQYLVRCFNAENEIKCCGHGMIAAAKTLFAEGVLSKVSINENIMISHDAEQEEEEYLKLVLPRISSNNQPLPIWASNSITSEGKNLLANNSAKSSENDGYLLFEFEPILPLDVFGALQLDLNQVCNNTKRAVVLVQFEQKNKILYLRYFAPQYGVSEDSATGSVMRFVSDYVEKKYHCKHFEVYQCSQQGGFMKVECTEEKIIITANATIEI